MPRSDAKPASSCGEDTHVTDEGNARTIGSDAAAQGGHGSLAAQGGDVRAHEAVRDAGHRGDLFLRQRVPQAGQLDPAAHTWRRKTSCSQSLRNSAQDLHHVRL